MKVLYLYAEVMGYTMATIRALADKGIEVHVVHRDYNKLTPYQPPKCKNVFMYKRSEMTLESINTLFSQLSPAVTVVSGWKDKLYMKMAKKIKSSGCCPVVVGLDGQWHGNARQHIAKALGNISYFSRYFSHAWVSGVYQYEYARKLGFDKKQIIFDLYSADLSLFENSFHSSFASKELSYPYRFLYVGRFEPVKGLDTLMDAWSSIINERRDWELHMIGNGSLKAELQQIAGVVVKDFMQPDDLINEVSQSGCFVLPSRGEPWGVVVHEFSASGLPLIISDVVGAASTFLVGGLNGYSFKSNDVNDLAEKMLKIIRLSDNDLRGMSIASNRLSGRISPGTSAGNLLSIC